MQSIKLLYSFGVLLLWPVSLSVAQTSPTTTNPTSTTSTNRQQELYDQHHGISRKPANPSTPTSNRAEQPRRSNDPTVTTSGSSAGYPQGTSTEVSMARVRIGVRGGLTYPVFTEKQPFVDPALGFVGGVTFNFGSGMFSFQPEVNYVRYNTKITVPFFETKITAAADRLEVPLFLKISTGSYAGHRFFVNVGPYGSYVASASSEGKKISLEGINGRFGFGAALGVGAALKAGPGHITVEVRGLYQLGDTYNGFNTDSRQSLFNTNSNTILTQATVGYSFPLGGR